MVENKVCFSRNVSTFSRPLAGGACCMAAHRVGGRMGDLFTAHEGRKNGTIRKEPRQLPFRTTCYSSRQPLSSPSPPRRLPTWRTRRHKKRPQRESTPLMGGFLAAGESRKSRFVLTSRGRPRGLRHSARRPWRQRRCPRRSLHLHHRGRVRRGARVARFRGRAPRERAKKCAFRRR